jgi:hypothetical protein
MYEPTELGVGVLEIFVEQYKWTTPRALLATHESGGERVGRNPKMKFFGFTLHRDWEGQASFQWRREAREQREMDERARVRRNWAAFYAVNAERRRASVRERMVTYRANMTPEQYAKVLASNREGKRRRKAEKVQTRRLEEWKATPRKKTKARLSALPATPETARAERRRAQRVAQAQRRRDRAKKAKV